MIEQDDKRYKTLLDEANAIAKDIKRLESINISDASKDTHRKILLTRRRRITNQFMRYAAFLAVPLLLATFYLGYVQFVKSSRTCYAEVTAAAGSVVRYELPDGSVVWLNAGSTLKYPTAFDKSNREVTLMGEAYFKVHADKKNPFYVNISNGLKIFVYGTEFNVSDYKDSPFIEAVLERGRVNVIDENKSCMYKLDPNESLIYNKRTHQVSLSAVDVYEKTAWKDGKMVFRDAPIEEVFDRLSRHFSVDIQLKNHLHNEYLYHATFRDESLYQIFECFNKSAPMHWQVIEPVQKKDGTFTRKKILVDLY